MNRRHQGGGGVNDSHPRTITDTKNKNRSFTSHGVDGT